MKIRGEVKETNVGEVKATGAENLKKTNNKVKEIEFQNIAQNRVKELRSQLTNSSLRKFGNLAIADVEIVGVKKEFYAHSGINSLGDKGSNVVEFFYLKAEHERNFSSYEIDKYPRYHDTEAKILEDIASQIKDRTISGRIKLFTERIPCASCSNIIEEFKKRFPNIKLEVFSKEGRWADLRKKGEKL